MNALSVGVEEIMSQLSKLGDWAFHLDQHVEEHADGSQFLRRSISIGAGTGLVTVSCRSLISLCLRRIAQPDGHIQRPDRQILLHPVADCPAHDAAAIRLARPRSSSVQRDDAIPTQLPYSASKASSDHLVRAYHHTYGLDVTTSNCSNNYGPYQYPEKLIPLFLLNALHGRDLPIYGDGMNVRDLLHVEDHCLGIEACLAKGQPGETYNIGGGAELPNMEVIDTICAEVDRAFSEIDDLAQRYPDAPAALGKHTSELKTFVTDRKGHNRRYAMDETKARRMLQYSPAHEFGKGLRQTLRWYLQNERWWQNVAIAEYQPN